ncbi:MAG: hypothetical protein G01um10143_826 [Parcubacteria group bacterium Gr01-1014_3]|nr:MAG: hypothetical protein G01um10143_826 [Parcubacteria group bacterium Gr01-1014_3]
MPNDKKYDLEDRTAKFSDEVLPFARSIKKDLINTPLVSQLVRSATSIGANYMEANGASSQKDFKNKIYICKKEARETKYWLERIAKANPEIEDVARKLWKEVQELTLIFSKITQTLERKI